MVLRGSPLPSSPPFNPPLAPCIAIPLLFYQRETTTIRALFLIRVICHWQRRGNVFFMESTPLMSNTQKIINYKPASVPSPYTHLHFQELYWALLKSFELVFVKLLRKWLHPKAPPASTLSAQDAYLNSRVSRDQAAWGRTFTGNVGTILEKNQMSTGRRSSEFPAFCAFVSQHKHHLNREFCWVWGPCRNEKKKEMSCSE